eukprot:jgi/Ulvmu1/491/UM001_0499.1
MALAPWADMPGLPACPQCPLQVYVAARPFNQFGGDLMQRLPGSAKELMVDIGVCHYMLIFQDVKGGLLMCDFGPIGGDVHVSTPNLQDTSMQPKSKAVAGEVRLTKISELPEACMHLGAAHVTLDAVREFNQQCDVQYELNVNDCRHYVNQLARLATGVPSATTCLLQHRFACRRTTTPKPVDHLLPPVQRLTDPNNWQRVQQSLRAAGAAVLLAASHPVLLPPLASTSTLAANAVQALTASAAAQRAAAAAAALAQHAALRKRALLSSCAVTLAGAAAPDPLRGVADMRAAVAGGISHGVRRVHSTADACAQHTHSLARGLLGPLAPFRAGLTSRLASLTVAAPSCVDAAAVDAWPGYGHDRQHGRIAPPPWQLRPKPVAAQCRRPCAAGLRPTALARHATVDTPRLAR